MDDKPMADVIEGVCHAKALDILAFVRRQAPDGLESLAEACRRGAQLVYEFRWADVKRAMHWKAPEVPVAISPGILRGLLDHLMAGHHDAAKALLFAQDWVTVDTWDAVFHQLEMYARRILRGDDRISVADPQPSPQIGLL